MSDTMERLRVWLGETTAGPFCHVIGCYSVFARWFTWPAWLCYWHFMWLEHPKHSLARGVRGSG